VLITEPVAPAVTARAVPEFLVVGTLSKVAKQHFAFVPDAASSVFVQSFSTLFEASYSHGLAPLTPH